MYVDTVDIVLETLVLLMSLLSLLREITTRPSVIPSNMAMRDTKIK